MFINVSYSYCILSSEGQRFWTLFCYNCLLFTMGNYYFIIFNFVNVGNHFENISNVYSLLWHKQEHKNMSHPCSTSVRFFHSLTLSSTVIFKKIYYCDMMIFKISVSASNKTQLIFPYKDQLVNYVQGNNDLILWII